MKVIEAKKILLEAKATGQPWINFWNEEICDSSLDKIKDKADDSEITNAVLVRSIESIEEKLSDIGAYAYVVGGNTKRIENILKNEVYARWDYKSERWIILGDRLRKLSRLTDSSDITLSPISKTKHRTIFPKGRNTDWDVENFRDASERDFEMMKAKARGEYYL